jgi:hypothetical protein
MKTDVIVAGGGLGGCCAAVAAARNGARTLLIERYGFLGGMATAGLVNPFMSYFAGKKQIIYGIFNEIISELEKKNGLGKNRQSFDEETLKIVLDELLTESGVKILFHTQLVGSEVRNNKIKTIEIFNKSGFSYMGGEIFIDSTGDGDLAAFSEVDFEIGRKEDSNVQPMTLCFRLAGVDTDRIPSRQELNKKYKKAKENGLINCPRENLLWFYYPRDGIIHFNTTRIINVIGTKGEDLSKAELEGRKQIIEIFSFLKKKIPAFKNAYIEKIAAQIGVRETRRIIGKYILRKEDILKAGKFADGIVKSSYPIDIHNPTGEGTVLERLKPGEWHHIPYRCLIPKKINNLLIGSRCISATHEAHSSLRIMPVVAAIGEAAGTAAAISIKDKVIPQKINIVKLRKTLKKQGACI